MNRIKSLLAIAVFAALTGIASASPIITTLNPSFNVFDVSRTGGSTYVNGALSNSALVYNVTSGSQSSINFEPYEGRSVGASTAPRIDDSTGLAWVNGQFGAGVGTRTGTVPVGGGTVTFNQFPTTTGTSTTVVTAAAGGFGFGQTQGRPAYATSGSSWSFLGNFGAIWDAVFHNGRTTAVGEVANAEGGTDGVVFTDLSLTFTDSCMSVFCSINAVSSDASLGGGYFGSQQPMLLNLSTGTRLLAPRTGEVRGVLGGPNSALFYLSSIGPRALRSDGTDQSYTDWFIYANMVALGFDPNNVGDVRVYNDMAYQIANSSVKLVNFSVPGGEGSNSNVPEPSTWVLMVVGLAAMRYFLGSKFVLKTKD